MHTVAQQLDLISQHIQRAAAERERQAQTERMLAERSAEARRRAWQTRKDSGKYAPTGLIGAVLNRMPVGIDNAIFHWQVEALVADVPHAPYGLSEALSRLRDRGLIARTGERRQYRYFKLQ